MKRTALYIAALLLAACSGKPDENAVKSNENIRIFPDYTDVVLPRNIAPANFMIDNEADAYFTIISNGDIKVEKKGRKVCFSKSEWNSLTDCCGSSIQIQVYTETDGQWTSPAPFSISLSDDLIDRYITYRRIPVAVEAYEVLDLCQRDITNFKEKIFFSNTMVQDNSNGTCVNCHHTGNYSAGKMQFHVRQFKGGTVLYFDGALHKVNMKTDSTMSAGVYPSWHPTHDYIAYSNNKTHQSIHAMSHDKIEVLEVVRDLAEAGFKFVATGRTCDLINAAGFKCEKIAKLNEGRPDVKDLIINKQVQLIINTPIGKQGNADDSYIRKSAIREKIPYITTIAAAKAAAKGILSIKRGQTSELHSLQELHSMIK